MPTLFNCLMAMCAWSSTLPANGWEMVPTLSRMLIAEIPQRGF
jgi:hypothetical protein